MGDLMPIFWGIILWWIIMSLTEGNNANKNS